MREVLRSLPVAAACLLAAASAQAATGPWFETPEAKVRWLSRYASAKPGGDAGLALEFQLAPGWHVYWKNAGDAGFPPALEPQGTALTGTELRFPAPSRFELPGDLVAFGYAGEAIYPVDAALAERIAPNASVTAQLDYLVCADSCIPYRTALALELPLGDVATLDAATAPRVDAARARLPEPAPAEVRGELVPGAEGEPTLVVTFAVAGIRAVAPDLFFAPHELLAFGRPRLAASAAGPGFRVPVRPIDPTRPLPERVRVAWTATGFERGGAARAWEGELDLAWPRAAGRQRPLIRLVPIAVALALFWLILARVRRARAGRSSPA